MTLDTIIENLEEASNPSRLKTLLKLGAKDNAIGVPLGHMRKLAKSVGDDHELGMKLWDLDIVDTQLLACMILDAKKISHNKALSMIQDAQIDTVLDDLLFRCLIKIDDKEGFMNTLDALKDDVYGKAYWAFIVDKIGSIDLDTSLADTILSRIEQELVDAPEKTQWMMNRALSELGFKHPDYTQRCIDLGEKLAVYKDMKVAKGCTSAYAPAWIEAVLKRKK